MKEHFKEQIAGGSTMLFYGIERLFGDHDDPSKTTINILTVTLDNLDSLNDLVYIRKLKGEGDVPLFKKKV